MSERSVSYYSKMDSMTFKGRMFHKNKAGILKLTPDFIKFIARIGSVCGEAHYIVAISKPGKPEVYITNRVS
jgi:hypothetical protein